MASLNERDAGRNDAAHTYRGVSRSQGEVNNIIQKHYRRLPNDGLIPEASSDLSRNLFATCAPGCRHDISYSDYATMNHTALVDSQIIANRAVSFAERPPPQSPPSPPTDSKPV